jgi:hypothetical protein
VKETVLKMRRGKIRRKEKPSGGAVFPPEIGALFSLGISYYLFPMLTAWTDVFEVPGTRATGDGAQVYAITGPGWKGKLPEGMKEYKSPTALVWFIGRIYCTSSPEDYAAVHKLEDAISLVPLSSFGKAYTPPPGTVDPKIDMKKAPKDQVNALGTQAYFELLAKL